MTNPRYNRPTVKRQDKVIVDRGDALDGFNKTLRDSRLPPTMLRAITNFRLPDQKAVRRRGFDNFITSLDGDSSSKIIKGMMLCKHTPSLIETAVDQHPSDPANPLYNKYQTYYRTPLSYGLIRWDDDVQPRTDRDWTLEFMFRTGDREELIENSVNRQMHQAVGASTDSCRLPGDCHGVYLYDQTVIGSHMRYVNDASVTKDPSALEEITLGVAAIAVSYRIEGGNLRISVAVGFFDPTTGIYEFDKLVYEGGAYVVGEDRHVAIRHDSSTRTVDLIIDGVLVVTAGSSIGSLTYAANLKWAGEDDLLGNKDKDVTDNFPKRRDIVVLNECTARGNYSSSTKSDGLNPSFNTFVESISNLSTEDRGSPWACSPPRGTSMGEIRFWHEKVSEANVLANKDARIVAVNVATPANLKMWIMGNEGHSLCLDKTGNKNHLTLHHGIAPTIDDAGLLNGKGLLLRDGQHLIKSYSSVVDGEYINDSFTDLSKVMDNRRTNTAAGDGVIGNFNSKFYDPDQDFTIQIQIRTPKNFQHNLSEYIFANNLILWPGVTSAAGTSFFDLRDGKPGTPIAFANSTGIDQGKQHLHPFMETLWSIEGTRFPDNGADTSNLSLAARVPLARGLLQAVETGVNAGKAQLVFEFFGAGKDSGGGEEPRYYKLMSTVFLDPDTVYTLTFRKITDFGLTDVSGGSTATTYINPVAARIEVFVDDAVTPDTLALIDTSPCEHGREYDVIIGASYVNNLVEKGLGYRGVSATAGNIVDQQHFMTQYNDQPGFFTLGFFRMWTAPLPQKQFVQWIDASLVDTGHQPALLYNLEIDGSKGNIVRSKARFIADFKKGFKSFGASSSRSLNNEFAFIYGIWSMEDSIGYTRLPDGFEDWTLPSCSGLAPFKTDEGDKYGLLLLEDSAIFKDLDGEGAFESGYLPSYGLLTEYGASDNWNHGLVDGRTFFYGRSGFPKVFNGKHFTTVGLRPWNAGQVHVVTSNPGGSFGHALDDHYIGIRIAYISEEFDIIASSPQFVAHIPSGVVTNKLTIHNLTPHPDPRVTNIYVYRTHEQVSYTEALIAPVYLTKEGPVQNKAIREINITLADSTLIAAPLDLDITVVPDAEYGAVLNDQLYLNDKTDPSSIFRSYPGNPEQFDKISTEAVLDQGAGDRINGMLSAFGAVFVFKSGSVWRIDPLDTINAQLTKINDLGLISSLGLALITPGDTGSQSIFVWTKEGPYLYDGVNWQYIGFATEGSLENPYDFLDPSTISVTHAPKDRELLCFYKSNNPDTLLGNAHYDGCLVYNYRFGVWYDYEGVPGFRGLTTVINASTQRDLILIGTERGDILEWGASDYDYLGGTSEGLVVSYAVGGVVVLDTSILTDNIDRLWITFTRYSGTDVEEFYSWPIEESLAADNKTLQLDAERNSLNLPFTPRAGDSFSVGLTPARITFPWDVLDVPWVDKQVVGCFFWLDKGFHMRTATNWAETFSTWSVLPSSQGKRRLTAFAPAKHCEALKLDLASFDPGARLDALAYQVIYHSEGVTKQ